ncbi:MAG: ABC transporter substrate-binding protein [Candidatus Rokubacteria bacterium]|nr:ABC transporter substrate-binding protein [Candidatus Rokubacteria bacterium]
MDGNHFTLFVAQGIAKPADLKGKSIGVTRVGATTWVFARLLAKHQGWNPDRDVKIVPLGGVDAQLAALSRGEIAGFVWGDGGAAFEAEGKGKVLVRLDTVTPKWISQIAMASEEGIKKNPDAIRRSLRGVFRAIKFMKENPAEAARILSPKLSWSEAAIKRAHQNSGPLLPADGRFSLENFKVMQDTLLDQGILKKRVPLEQHYTTDFVPVRL